MTLNRTWISRVGVFSLFILLAGSTAGQEVGSVEQSESDFELLMKAEADLRLVVANHPRRQIFALRAHKNLQSILKRNPDSPLRFRILEDLKPLDEILGQHNLEVAKYYMKRDGSLRGAEGRLHHVLEVYTGFSRMDEVLFLLAECAAREKRHNDAVQHLSQLVCSYPGTSFAESAIRKLGGMESTFEGCHQMGPKAPSQARQ